MSVGFGPPVNPDRIPEHHLWTLTKDTRQVECRVRMVPLGAVYRIYYNGAFLRSEVVRDRNVGDAADDVKQQWLAFGGRNDAVAHEEPAVRLPKGSRRT